MLWIIRKAVCGISERLLTRGPRYTARWIQHGCRELWRERWLGIETASYADWQGLSSNRMCLDYEPLRYTSLDAMIQGLDVNPERDVFLDYGCGKGRAVVVAATRPFRRVIGVDMVEDLCTIARQNVLRARRRLKCEDIEIIPADATQFEVPDDVTMIYLYNSFRGDVLTAVQKRIRDSLERVPRKLTILYIINPGTESTFDDCDWLTCIRDDPEFWEGVRYLVYEGRASAPTS